MKPEAPGKEASSTARGKDLEAWLPILLSLWREKRGREGGLQGSLQSRERDSVGSALLRLQRGLTGDRRLAGAGYMADPELLGAYLLYYWPVSYLETVLALAMIRRPARRVLDLGAGPGPAAAAFLDAGTEEFCLIDGEKDAVGLAEGLFSAFPHRKPRRLTTLRFDLESAPALPSGPFDAVVLGHVLNELWKSGADRLERRLALLEAAGTRLAPEGFLLVIEPSTQEASRETLVLRDGLVRKGWTIAAPCVRQGPCPALAAGPARSCHGEAPWDPPSPIAELARAAGLDRGSVKATWFAALPPGSRPESSREGSISADDLGPARVVSEGLLNKAGRLRYLLCGEEGYLTLSAPGSAAGNLDFAALGRYDLVRVRNPERREGGGFGLGPESRLELLERAPRPCMRSGRPHG